MQVGCVDLIARVKAIPMYGRGIVGPGYVVRRAMPSPGVALLNLTICRH